MKSKRTRIVGLVVMALAAMAVMLAACSCSQPVQRSSETDLEVNDAVKESTSATDPFYVLIVGNDTREGTVEITKSIYANGNARSDVIMLARVDPQNYKITLVTVSRDTQDEVNGAPAKLNANYEVGGMPQIVSAVEKLTGVTIDHYLNTTFVGFQDIVNALGGIDIYVPVDQSMQDIVSGNYVEYSAGEQELDGAEALVFARERHKYEYTGESIDALRQTNDRMILKTIIEKILAQPDTAGSLAASLYSFVDTDFTSEELVGLVEDFAAHADQVEILSGTGPYEGGSYNTDTGEWLSEYSDSYPWMAYRDEDTWSQIIATIEAGGDPNEVIAAPSLY